MRKVGIIIAVEQYSDNRISHVDYAEVDAKDLSIAFNQNGFASMDQLVLININATKTSIESRVRQVLINLDSDDVLYFYYAGHGFAHNSNNYLTCYDTNLDDLENTSIAIEWLFKLFKQTACKKIVMFLDSCESGMFASTTIRGIYTDLTDKELKAFFDKGEHCVCFAACKPGQNSHSSGKIGHGIWTYHVIEAFNANAPLALVKKHLITSSSLQNYLCKEVPRTLRTMCTGTPVQTPWLYGSQSGDFLIADVETIISQRNAAANPGSKQLLNIRLCKDLGMKVSRLSGFHKTYRIPDRVNGTTQAFIAKIASNDVNDALQNIFENLRNAFGFKRRDLVTVGPTDGSGSIITPYFDYAVIVSHNSEDPSEVIWHHEIMNIREPNQILTDAFEQVFSGKIDTLEFSTGKVVNLNEIIDQIEDLDENIISVDYDKDLSWCTIHVTGFEPNIYLTPTAFKLVQKTTRSPKLLIESFFQVQKMLVDTHQIKQLPFNNPI